MAVGTSSLESLMIAVEDGLSAPITAAEVALPDDILYEVVEGQIVEKTVGVRQVAIAFALAHALESFAKPRRLGRAITEMIFWLNKTKDLQRRPDAAFVSAQRWPFRLQAPDTPVWDIVPDLAVEVVSPSNSADEIHQKIQEYFEAGVRQVWVVFLKPSAIYVYSSPKLIQVFFLGEELDGDDLLPGFRLALSALFEDEPETE